MTTTKLTSRGTSELARRAGELELEIERLTEERRAIVARLNEAAPRPARRGLWIAAVGGALATAILALPVVVAISRPAPPSSVVVSPSTSVVVAPPVVTAVPPPLPPAPVAVPAPEPVRATPPAAATGALTVVCMPKCESVVMDGTSLGAGHIFNRPTATGRHVLQLGMGAVRKTVVIDVRRNELKDVRVHMMDEPLHAGLE